MNSYKIQAKITGLLFITATVAGLISAIILGPILEASIFLTEVSTNENLVLIGALLELIMAVAVAGIAISMYPILKKYNEGIALGSVGFRIMEGSLFMVGVIFLLLLLPLSQAFITAGSPSSSYFQTLGDLLLSSLPWTVGGIAFCLGALLYNTLFYQTKLIPRWLSLFGLIAIILALSSYLIQFFSINIDLIEILHFPTLVQEMVFAVWLIVKGFNSSVIVS